MNRRGFMFGILAAGAAPAIVRAASIMKIAPEKIWTLEVSRNPLFFIDAPRTLNDILIRHSRPPSPEALEHWQNVYDEITFLAITEQDFKNRRFK